ncbi:hypothetical protein L0657_10795 [Dyadobacter sp. CY345]|uniref:hypothetical protein n=1 Tax=Dyadobacter sp. CY345 TaxID=2909335 RepID=UPI001F2F4ABE|nr:hypothetical protein [Dyadobacter sp. CY345]MCF2444443.1 hypothetical protein [Dyadobacter sp. CY345]
MYKLATLLCLICVNGFCQNRYTSVRAGVGVEAFGIAPQGQVYAEAFFGNLPRSFWNVQAGLGIIDGSDFLTYSFSGALTYSYLLNPYRRTQCNPVPGHNNFEAYLEAGVASFFCDTKFNESMFYVPKTGREPLFTPLGLAGLRFHFVSEKFIYILKARYTPALIESRYASVAGLAVGFGWR